MAFNSEFNFLTRREIEHRTHLFVHIYEPPDEREEIIPSSTQNLRILLENKMCIVGEELFFSCLN